jgi:uncharacterized protein (TIGR03000 family)
MTNLSPTSVTPVAASGSAILKVRVPADAKIFVNDALTKSTGETRAYVSSPLLAGQTYTYEFRAEMVVDGKPVTQNKSVTVRAGQTLDLTFDASNVQVAAN